MAGVRFEGVWKLFGSTVAVSDLNLEVEDSEFLVFVGPSGCGKTTSLRLLGGLELPSYGRIWIDDRDVTRLSPGRRDVSMVFQNYALYPHMTVYKNLAFGPAVRREPKQDIEARVREVAEILGIESLLGRKPSQLSGGQRQRVALGRALVRQPQLFLLDEPLSNLDATLRVQMRTELVLLHNRLKVTTVYVTHDQIEALTMGDRVAVFNHGVLLQLGTPNDLYDNPSSQFVAGFIGSPKMNFFDGQVTGSGRGELVISWLGVTTTLRGPSVLDDNVIASEVAVGLRPHDIYMASEAPARCVSKLTGTVELVEHGGSEAFAEIVTPNGAHIMTRLHRTTALAIGDSTEIAFDPNDMHVFARDTGNSILDRSTMTGPERLKVTSTRTGAEGASPDRADTLGSTASAASSVSDWPPPPTDDRTGYEGESGSTPFKSTAM